MSTCASTFPSSVSIRSVNRAMALCPSLFTVSSSGVASEGAQTLVAGGVAEPPLSSCDWKDGGAVPGPA
jgi:hypothetical protein